MPNWLLGFTVFAVGYCAIIAALGYTEWDDIDIRPGRSLASELPAEMRQLVEAVNVTREASGAYPVPNEPENMLVRAGHSLVLPANASAETARQVTGAYAKLLNTYAARQRGRFILQILAVLVIPLFTLAFFVWLARKLWNGLGGMR